MRTRRTSALRGLSVELPPDQPKIIYFRWLDGGHFSTGVRDPGDEKNRPRLVVGDKEIKRLIDPQNQVGF